MSYRIVYGPIHKEKQRFLHISQRFQFMTAVCLLLFVLMTKLMCPEGVEILRSCLIPGKPTVTEVAFSDMVNQITGGEPIDDALMVFCKQILEEAQISD